MKRKTSFLILIYIFLNLLVGSYGVNISEYEYKSTLSVSCKEYKGYAKASLPQEYLSIENPKSYMSSNYFIDKRKGIEKYVKQKDWYVQTISNYEISEIENMYDRSYSSYFLSENNSVEFDFNNPQNKRVEKISIDIIDSEIESLLIYDKYDEEIEYQLNQDSFRYELILDSPQYSDEIRFELTYPEILKIRDISFYSKKIKDSNYDIYFYVDNNCNNNFTFYFGNYGENKEFYGFRDLPVEFETKVETRRNPSYDNDFDNDGIVNKDDNCIYINNSEQEDITYSGVGDACEDWDKDRVLNYADNCPNTYNPKQLDSDEDGVGDACDSSDNRLFEQNPYIIYALAFIIGLLFLFFSLKLFLKKN